MWWRLIIAWYIVKDEKALKRVMYGYAYGASTRTIARNLRSND